MIRMPPSEVVRRATIVLDRERHGGQTELQRTRNATQGRIIAALKALKDPGPVLQDLGASTMLSVGALEFLTDPDADPAWKTTALAVHQRGNPLLVLHTGSLPPGSPFRSAPSSPENAVSRAATMLRAAAAVMLRISKREYVLKKEDWIKPMNDACLAIGHQYRPGSPDMTMMIPRTPFAPLAVATFDKNGETAHPTDEWDDVVRPAFELDLHHGDRSSSIKISPISITTNEMDAMEALRAFARVAEMRNDPWWK